MRVSMGFVDMCTIISNLCSFSIGVLWEVFF